jgi:hypothetical protein
VGAYMVLWVLAGFAKGMSTKRSVSSSDASIPARARPGAYIPLGGYAGGI